MTQVPPAHPSPAPAPQQPQRTSDPARTRFIIIWVIVGVMLLGAAASAVGSLQRTVYGARGTVTQYLDALQRGDAASALDVPGVKLSADELKSAGLPENASDKLLRNSVISPVTETSFVSDTAMSDGTHQVTYDFMIGDDSGTAVFELTKIGGFFGHWEFSTSPLAAVNLSVNHTTQFSMNGADFDMRQVAPKGTEPAFDNIVNVLIFTPGRYDFAVDTDYLTADADEVFADSPGQVEEASVDAEPTDAFIEAAQEQFNAQLDECATQVILQPTGCPFGFEVTDRVSGEPAWSISSYPEIELVPGSNSWEVPNSEATATIDVDIQSLADGSIDKVTENVPFKAFGNVYLFSDGTVTAQLLTKETASGDDEDDAN
ncbi:hypothetical protein [Paramicrobacterium agarici]|uniref:hypothetical protein n=1 Tax=Paramicrobacterium agarici TaxID=630514 RepID=UPI001154E916|nr:hypothetical protein [Microbacterium agarici]TQO23245.1 hypothetical protein FB385_2091 [Microbacterium agarici]